MEQQIRESIEDEVRLIVTKLIKDLKKTGNHLNGTAIDYWNVSFSESIKEQVKKRDGYACRICKKDTDLHVHHRIKRKNGGDHSMENLITLCGSCHRAVETGDLAHAIRKCTRNAFMHYHIPVAKLEEKLNKAEERAQTRADLKEIFRLIAEDEKEDALVLLDRLIERYEG
ncbi:HNH endonuclease [Staphylospora marina]|uniref:HNH endonuclease n=1 Tax=Staphylospora marina TaxID=2490858 RepID=UPI0013DE2AFD|nr:HNH endonuclease [Staphylospora marina]